MAYATLAELKAFVGIPDADTADNATLTLALDSASAQIDAYCGRGFNIDGSVVARSYAATAAAGVDIDPVATLTGVVVETDDNDDGTYETTWTVGTDYRLEPANAAALGVPWTRLVATGSKQFPKSNRYFPGVRVTAKYGWPGAPPAPIKQATLLLASKLFKRKDAPFGVAGSAEFGSEMRILPGDLDAERLLGPYRRNWVFV
jgi:hypothetical protein